jgi:hypothetical protein
MTPFVQADFHTRIPEPLPPLVAHASRRTGSLARRAAGPILALLVGLQAGTAKADCADLSLVLAIDASSSVNDDEYKVQTQGYAAALVNPEVQRALADAGRVEMAVVFWADASMPRQVIPWRDIRDPGDAAAFGAQIVGTQRRSFGNTDIGSGLDAALDLLDQPGRCTARAVVNISGDGRESVFGPSLDAIPIEVARARALALGVTVNALAILTDEPVLDDYYRANVVTGPGAFVMTVEGFDTFAEGIQRKLVREIAPFVGATLAPDGPPRPGHAT